MTSFVGLRATTYSYLTHDSEDDKEAKDTKNWVIKRKLKLEIQKNYLKATQLNNKILYLEKNEISVDSLEKDHKEFITNNKFILKTQQIF